MSTKLAFNQVNGTEINASDYGVVADSDGTTGNGTDDTAAWIAAIAAAKASPISILIGPHGRSRITSTLDMTTLVAEFNGIFVKDFDGNGINIQEGGSTFTELVKPRIVGVGTQSAGSKGFNVKDSRVKIYRGQAKNHGGSGYYHLDDDGNNNHCQIDMLAENNGGTTQYNVHIAAGLEGDDSNNWKVDFQTFGGGGGVLIDADCKDWTGRIKAEDSTLDGLRINAGNRYDLNVYLENNGGNDYNFQFTGFVTLRGRLGGGSTGANVNYHLQSGGNDRQVKGDTTGLIERIENTNLSNSGSEYMTRRYSGSSSQVCFRERYFGNSDYRVESIDRTDGTTVQAVLGVDASLGAVLYGNGTLFNRLHVGNGSPEGVVSASVGDMYNRKDGGVGTTLYIKESGTGNTGWVAK